MEELQLFRLIGTTDIKRILCSQVYEKYVVYWEDIERVFPGVKYVQVNGAAVNMMRDQNQNRDVPYRIQHYPGVELDVVLSTTGGCDRAGSSVTTASLSPTDGPTGVSTSAPFSTSTTESIVVDISSDTPLLDPQGGGKMVSRTTLSSKQVVLPAQKESLESEIEQRLISFSPEVQAQVLLSNSYNSMVQAIKKGQVEQSNRLMGCLLKLKDALDKNSELTAWNYGLTTENNILVTQMVEMQRALDAKQDEMKQLQIQALSQLALLQKQVQAVLTQTYELHEYPIPRLFVVLPQDSTGWNRLNSHSPKFRLYFLCECGEHTKSKNSKSKIPHHIHLAKHEGYDIARPTEFFDQYGSYVLTILRMLKFGISVAGVIVPAVSHLVRTDFLDQTCVTIQLLERTIMPGMNQVIEYLEKTSVDESQTIDGIMNNEALEGADLRKLDTFLKNKDGNKVLGNLYRTVTSDGHVKWVCIDHYRENYQSKAAESFRDAMKAFEGSFDESVGRVEVKVRSPFQAEQFYMALEKARSVYELKIEIFWDATYNDFNRLQDTVLKTNVGVFELQCYKFKIPTSDILNWSKRYDPIIDIMRHPSIQSFAYPNTRTDFFKRSNLLSRNDNFSNLRYLEIDLIGLDAVVPNLKCLVSKASQLKRLILQTCWSQIPTVYSAIVEHQTCPVTFKYINELLMRILPPSEESQQSEASLQDLAHLFRVYGRHIEAINLRGVELDNSVMDAFAEGIQNGSRLRELPMESVDRTLGAKCIKNLAKIVAQSEVRELIIDLKDEEERVVVMETIPWRHIRELNIELKQSTQERGAMKALVHSMERVSERVELEYFRLYCSTTSGGMSLAEEELLRTFVSSTSLKHLILDTTMTLKQILSVIKSIDVTRLQHVTLRTGDFHSTRVQSILDSLRHATELVTICLIDAIITEEQVEQMKAKGILLSNEYD
ncbi:hypothetical protein BGZ65_003641 [Modicella reniformis]|uniref:Uncharacterized protein n=1 Tax=Modicella reniformis TaxID=1440133 RepID=A0A9P6SQ20_9FUNG|nr:hypothetical protein BGZ65_003641 [Modicella reniformis]